MSNSTIISMCQYDINETKPGLYPGNFSIPKANQGDFSFIQIGDSVAYLYLDESRGTIQVPQDSQKIAESICHDHIYASIATDMRTETHPGLFWVPGHHLKDVILKEYSQLLHKYFQIHDRWLLALVKLADDDWTRNQSHRSITNIQRQAASALETRIGKKPWNVEVPSADEFVKCKFCQSTISVRALVCPVCTRAQVPEDKLKDLINASR